MRSEKAKMLENIFAKVIELEKGTPLVGPAPKSSLEKDARRLLEKLGKK